MSRWMMLWEWTYSMAKQSCENHRMTRSCGKRSLFDFCLPRKGSDGRCAWMCMCACVCVKQVSSGENVEKRGRNACTVGGRAAALSDERAKRGEQRGKEARKKEHCSSWTMDGHTCCLRSLPRSVPSTYSMCTWSSLPDWKLRGLQAAMEMGPRARWREGEGCREKGRDEGAMHRRTQISVRFRNLRWKRLLHTQSRVHPTHTHTLAHTHIHLLSFTRSLSLRSASPFIEADNVWML